MTIAKRSLKTRCSILGITGVFAMMLTALATGPAQAAVPSDEPGDRILTAPMAPRSAQPGAGRAAAVSPSISPSVRTAYVSPTGQYSCSSGNLCTLAWDPTKSNWKIFYLYQCNRYSLSNWLAGGYYFDNQVGGVTSYFYDQSGNILKSFTPDNNQHEQNWTPVWSIRNC